MAAAEAAAAARARWRRISRTCSTSSSTSSRISTRCSSAQASAALDKLREAQQRLERNQGGRSDRDVQQALADAQQLAEEQKQVAEGVKSLDQAGADRQAKAQALAGRKDAMDQKLGNL